MLMTSASAAIAVATIAVISACFAVRACASAARACSSAALAARSAAAAAREAVEAISAWDAFSQSFSFIVSVSKPIDRCYLDFVREGVLLN